MVRTLRRVSIIEAVSYLVLVAAAIVKRAGGTDLGVRIVGPVHGVLFLVYAGLLLRDHRALGWPLWKPVTAMVIGSLPFGGFWIERRWLAPLDDGSVFAPGSVADQGEGRRPIRSTRRS